MASASSTSNPSLLILDGHATHSKNIDIIDLARSNGVTILVLPPHCSHRLQPLDISFMKPLSTYYNQECEKWLRSHPGRVITMFQVGSIFGSAYIRAAKTEVAVNGFKATGIFPVNRHVFADCDFAPSDVTDQPFQPSDPAPVGALLSSESVPSPSESTGDRPGVSSQLISPESIPVDQETTSSQPPYPVPSTYESASGPNVNTVEDSSAQLPEKSQSVPPGSVAACLDMEDDSSPQPPVTSSSQTPMCGLLHI